MSRHLHKIAGVCGLVLLLTAPFSLDLFWINMLVLALISSVAVFSLTILTGLTGLLSFGQAGFVGLGAYTYGVLSLAGVAPGLAALAGLALPTVTGLLLGLPAARLKGHYMAIGTLGFGVLVAQLLNNLVDVTRGPMGLIGIRNIGLDRVEWYYVALAVALAVMVAINVIDRRTFFGVVLKSVKHDEVSAAASGINVFAVKLTAFCLSAFLAGLSGVMTAAYMRFLTPDLFLPAESFRYLMMAVVGGVGSATGALIASFILTAVPEVLRTLGETNLRLLVYGVMVLFVLWFIPGGIGGLIFRLAPKSRASRSTASDADAPGRLAPGTAVEAGIR